jgi:diguanylate cyclase (GGDEF)-like protein
MSALRQAVPRLLSALCLLLSALGAGGAPRLGYPLLTAFDQQQHHGGSQNFALAQDTRGILYFANLRGVLTYDGAWWNLVTLPRNAPALGIAIDDAGHIGAGTVDDLGTLVADREGQLHFQSLLPLLPPALRGTSLGEFQNVVADGNTLLFLSPKIVLQWDGKRVTVLVDDRAHESLRRAFVEGGRVFVSTRDGLQEAGGARQFAGKRVDLLLGDVVVVRNEGMFTRDGKPVASPASEWLKQKVVMDGCVLPDGRRVIATLRDGVAVLDANGNLEQVIGRDAGLPESLVYGARPDSEGSLWIVHDLGMVRVDLGSAVSLIDERSGLKGSVHDVIRHQGKLIAASSHGLYVIDEPARAAALAGKASAALPSSGGLAESTPNSSIHTIDGIIGSPWCALSLGDELLAGASSGVYVIRGDGKPQRVAGTETFIVYAIAMAPGDPSHVYLGCPDGLGSLRRGSNGWHFEGYVPAGKPYVREFVEFRGELWCGTTYDGGMHIDAKGNIHPFGSGDLAPVVVDGRMVITTDENNGHFLTLTRDDRLIPDPVLGSIRGTDKWDAAGVDSDGNLWLNTSPPSVVRRLGHDHYDSEARVPVAMPAGDVEIIHRDDDGTMWIGGDHGLYHVASRAAASALVPPEPVLRRIVSGNDQVLFGGFGTLRTMDLPYAFQRLRIEVGPASFHPGVHYQYRLDPVDERWSVWRDEPFLEYTNLAEGRYTFRVHTRGASGQIGKEKSWTFTVLPPWYRASWAVVLWIALAALLVAVLVSLRTRSLRRQAETLRARVAEQTIALREANAQLAKLAVSDDLTGIPNRREFERALAAEWERAIRHQAPLALIFLDLDHFKTLNDTRGHQAGDECLRQVGFVLSDEIRGSGDVVARYGGEEFALLLPATDAPGAAIVAERLRQTIERMHVDSGAPHHIITASFGVAAIMPAREIEPSTLVAHADRALYAAKRGGRNCVRIDNETAQAGSWLQGTA